MVHRLRSRCDYVITGSNTVIQDNPSFSCRRGVAYTRNGGRKPADGPTRVILDRSLKTFLWETSNFPETLTILHPTENSTPPSAPTIIYHTSLPPHPNPSPKVSLKKLEGEERIGRRIIDDLGENSEEDQAIMIEGGGNLAKVFLEDDAITHCIIIQSPLSLFPPPPVGVSSYVNSDRSGLRGFSKVGEYDSGGDTVECWCKDRESWMEEEVEEWP
ncbi:hypothetical protein TrVE_jg3507 [Triparma verrucosa]|uniref:Bacterial bifunctional deaminase-reductase C-terminal domain-containing protein n=1 Tax=Triparma verrucosa TaxID=1606542 RepID=A0A9W7EN14_9STRA|nr:hypothetical protein TrVE_jg3507 [Triparma verrucosa]